MSDSATQPRVPPIVLMCAFRYALGRKSYITDVIAEVLEVNVDALTPGWRTQVADDIDRAVEQGYAGMPQDVRRWQRCAEAMRRA